MSKITNDGLTRSGTGYSFIGLTVPIMATVGVTGLNPLLPHRIVLCKRLQIGFSADSSCI